MKKIHIKSVFMAVLVSVFAFGMSVSCSDAGDPNGGGYSEPGNSTPGGGNSGKPSDDNGAVPGYDDSSLSPATLFVVGDSTVCDYTKADGTLTDATYYYPRYGYGTQLYLNLSDKITVKNLALSGRSSKSFLAEENYQTLKNSIKAGDFLVIGFGHNDQKSDDEARFASAQGSTETEGSFKYNLYNYYVKLALDKGATPILCSPICRAASSNDYSGQYSHVTSTGDYGTAVKELAEEKNVQFVDLRGMTKNLYMELGYNEAIYFHAMTQGESNDNGVTVTPKLTSVDTTHINIYGAKKVSYFFAKTILESDCALKPYIKSAYNPVKETDLVKNPDYKWTAYAAVDWEKYSPAEHFKTITSGWYGTAFGDCGGAPATSSNGYTAKETSAGTFLVGQSETSSPKGKITNSTVGIAFAFRQIPVSKNFTLSAKATVKTVAETNQAGFGLMLRDDCYEPVNDKSIVSNFVAAGLYASTTANSTVNFSFASSLKQTANSTGSLYAEGETADLKIERVGQVVTVTTAYKGNEYKETYTDFDFVAKDSDYFYAGFFATRGTTIEVTDVNFEITGESQGA